MMKTVMKSEIQEITPEFLFLKYKGVPSPWEFIAQSKRFGFKCKKYANWSDVHVSENSRDLLKSIGSLLIDSEELEISEYGELSRIWERVQRWPKDKESFSIEPDVLPEYEKISRLLDVGSKKPDVIDLMIDEFGIESNSLNLDERWLVFLAICIENFFQSSKRYQLLFVSENNNDKSKISVEELIESVASTLVQLYLQIGFDISSNESNDTITLFVKELGLIDTPQVTERNSTGRIKTLPKVWVENYQGSPSELVKFNYSDGSIIVKLNKSNRLFGSKSTLANLLSEEEFWNLIGYSLHSHINQIDEIQDFFDTFAKQIRLRG